MRQKEYFKFLNDPEDDIDGLISIHGIFEVKESCIELSESKLSIQTLEALEDGWRFVIPKTLSVHLCQMLGRVNYRFQKFQHGCPHILEVVPEILHGLPTVIL